MSFSKSVGSAVGGERFTVAPSRKMGNLVKFHLLGRRNLAICLLICQPFVAVSQKDDATILESVFHDVMLHDVVVAVRVDADVAFPLKAKLHDTLEDTMHIGKAGNAVDNVVG